MPRLNSLALAPQASRDSLTFVWSSTVESAADRDVSFGFSVVACGTSRAMWTIASDGSRSLPAQFAYGDSLAGFRTVVPAARLAPGCYDAIVAGARPLRFTVDDAGRATVVGTHR